MADYLLADTHAPQLAGIAATLVKRRLKALLAAELPARLADVDAKMADGIVTEVPFEIYTTAKADIGGTPSIELILTDSTPTMPESMAQIYRHRIIAGISVASDDEERTTAMTERYVWCIRQLARDTHAQPYAYTGPIDCGGEQYSPTVQRPETVERPFVQGAFIELFLTTVE